MAHIYSEIIFEGHNIGGQVDIGLDAAYVWIVRDVCWFFPGPDEEAQLNIVAAATGGTFISDAQAAVDNPGYSSHWEGRQVFVPIGGQPTLTILTSSLLHAPDVRISGYRLTPP